MEKRSIVLFVVVFAAIVLGMFVFAYLKRQELAQTPSLATSTAPIATTTPYVARVDAKHFFVDGEHTFVGVIDMPTPCDLLDVESFVQESQPETIVLNFTVTNNADVCAQVVTPQRFMVKAAASPAASVRATWGGVPIDINLIPAAAGERPEDFELFIKG